MVTSVLYKDSMHSLALTLTPDFFQEKGNLHFVTLTNISRTFSWLLFFLFKDSMQSLTPDFSCFLVITSSSQFKQKATLSLWSRDETSTRFRRKYKNSLLLLTRALSTFVNFLQLEWWASMLTDKIIFINLVLSYLLIFSSLCSTHYKGIELLTAWCNGYNSCPIKVVPVLKLHQYCKSHFEMYSMDLVKMIAI